MKLNQVQVTNFRSVYDSGNFNVDRVTCLVGKKRGGKECTALGVGSVASKRSDTGNDG